MRPITFRCRRVLPYSAEQISAAIADTSRWGEFAGYGPLPGVAHAEYEHLTEQMVGSLVRVRNTDGSSHLEEITAWEPGSEIALTFRGFTPPLSRLATHFTEVWTFQPHQQGTLVTRTFGLFPSSWAARPVLWLISLLLRRAIDRQLAAMAAPVAT